MSTHRIINTSYTRPEPANERRIFTYKASQLIWLLLGILDALIALRIGLKLIGANPASPIVELIYGFTTLFLNPFTGLINSPTVGNLVLEIYAMFAMLIYALAAWILDSALWLIFYQPPSP